MYIATKVQCQTCKMIGTCCRLPCLNYSYVDSNDDLKCRNLLGLLLVIVHFVGILYTSVIRYIYIINDLQVLYYNVIINISLKSI